MKHRKHTAQYLYIDTKKVVSSDSVSMKAPRPPKGRTNALSQRSINWTFLARGVLNMIYNILAPVHMLYICSVFFLVVVVDAFTFAVVAQRDITIGIIFITLA